MQFLLRLGRLLAVGMISLFALSGCITANFYVAKDLPMRSRADLVQVQHPKPVQLLFEFRQRGATAALGTSKIRPIVTAVANESGLFASVSQTPVDGGVLTVVIDNRPLTPEDEHKGFATGLTLGMAGTLVGDGYTCTATYTSGGKTTTADVKHAIYTAIGNHAGPPGLQPMQADPAVTLAMRQIMWNLLKQLGDKNAFE